jgi:colanic acid biosynthesis glycosyl transferase WcaI
VSSSGARRRLLLVSTNYAPEHAGIGPYATQIAEHWAADGAEVHVLTGLPHYPAWRVDPAYAGVKRVEEERAGVRVHRRGHAVPARQTALRRALFEVSVLRGGREAPAGMARPDAVFAQMPSLAGGVLAARLAERFGAPFVPIVQDLMGAAAAQSGIRGGGLAAAGAGAVERYALRRAALVGVIHETFVDKVAAMGVPESRIRLVRNWSHVQRPSRPRAEMRARLGWRPGQTVLLHAGNMGVKQGLDVLVEAARLAPEVRIVLMGDGNQRDHLRSLSGGLPNLDFMPPAQDAEFPDVLAAADVLLVTQRASVRDMSLPSKLTSYFAAGRPVIAAVAADSGTAQEVVRSAAGLVVPPESPADLLAAVRTLAADPARVAALAAAGPDYAATHLTREAGLARIDSLLAEALSTARRPAGAADRVREPGADLPPASAGPAAPPRPAAPPAPAAPPVPTASPTAEVPQAVRESGAEEDAGGSERAENGESTTSAADAEPGAAEDMAGEDGAAADMAGEDGAGAVPEGDGGGEATAEAAPRSVVTVPPPPTAPPLPAGPPLPSAAPAEVPPTVEESGAQPEGAAEPPAAVPPRPAAAPDVPGTRGTPGTPQAPEALETVGIPEIPEAAEESDEDGEPGAGNSGRRTAGESTSADAGGIVEGVGK